MNFQDKVRLLNEAISSKEVRKVVGHYHGQKMNVDAYIAMVEEVKQEVVKLFVDDVDLGKEIAKHVVIAKKRCFEIRPEKAVVYGLAGDWSFDETGQTPDGDWERVV